MIAELHLAGKSIMAIAKAVGIKPRTVQKRIKALHAVGLLTRTERRKTRFGSDTNLYSFEGLIKAAVPYAKEKIAEREADFQRDANRAGKLPRPDPGQNEAFKQEFGAKMQAAFERYAAECQRISKLPDGPEFVGRIGKLAVGRGP